MRTRASVGMRSLSNTKLKFESDDEDFETPAFQNIEKQTERRQSEDSSDESEDNVVVKSDDDASEDDEDNARDFVSDDDSDDMPDDISFSQSQQTALTQIKMAMKQISEEKSKKKMKRKQIDELFKEQKRKKFASFVTQKLPDDILDSVASEPELKGIRREKKPVLSKSDRDRHSDHSDVKKVKKNEGFIPLTSKRLPGIQAVSLRDPRVNHKTLAESAAEFRQNRLYGGKVRREKLQDTLSRMEKRKARCK